MLYERDDLDGHRLTQPGTPDVWLMFHGKRHRVASPEVYDSLWSEVDRVVPSDEIDAIALGPELNDGTCLIRPRGFLSIYLLTGARHVHRLFIPTFETLRDFGFDEAKVHDIPPLVLEAIPDGGTIESAADRRARAG